MSKSLTRVKNALAVLEDETRILEMPGETRTAEQAAEAAGCELDQIAKSIIFRGDASGDVYLFLTAGGNRVSAKKASHIVSEQLGRADANEVRRTTGFAIGGVAPVGLLNPVTTYFDPRLLDFKLVWAAAGTPRHIFAISPKTLLSFTGAKQADFVD